MGRGNIRPEEYAHFHAGIGGIQGHLFSGRINGENAGLRACEVMYLAACIRAGHTKFRRIEEPEKYKTEKLTLKNSKKIAYVRNVDLQAYGYLVEALRLSDDIDIQQR
ncbi:MAG: hypothetical protein VB031_03980 [Eubacteriaceae bacterium]|nr:hypothetical protein [Eubacteriaceae bacterium]